MTKVAPDDSTNGNQAESKSNPDVTATKTLTRKVGVLVTGDDYEPIGHKNDFHNDMNGVITPRVRKKRNFVYNDSNPDGAYEDMLSHGVQLLLALLNDIEAKPNQEKLAQWLAELPAQKGGLGVGGNWRVHQKCRLSSLRNLEYKPNEEKLAQWLEV